MTKFINRITKSQYRLMTFACAILNIVNGLGTLLFKNKLFIVKFSYDLNNDLIFSKLGICVLIINNIALLLLITVLFCRSNGLNKKDKVIFRIFLLTTLISVLCVIYEIIYSIKVYSASLELENVILWTKNIYALYIFNWIVIIVSVLSLILSVDTYLKKQEIVLNTKKPSLKYLIILITPLLSFAVLYFNEKREMKVEATISYYPYVSSYDYDGEGRADFDMGALEEFKSYYNDPTREGYSQDPDEWLKEYCKRTLFIDLRKYSNDSCVKVKQCCCVDKTSKNDTWIVTGPKDFKKVKNGDVFEIKMDFDHMRNKEIYDKYNIKITSKPFKKTVTELKTFYNSYTDISKDIANKIDNYAKNEWQKKGKANRELVGKYFGKDNQEMYYVFKHTYGSDYIYSVLEIDIHSFEDYLISKDHDDLENSSYEIEISALDKNVTYEYEPFLINKYKDIQKVE